MLAVEAREKLNTQGKNECLMAVTSHSEDMMPPVFHLALLERLLTNLPTLMGLRTALEEFSSGVLDCVDG